MDMLKKLYKLVSPKYKALFLDYNLDMRPRSKDPHPVLEVIIKRNDSLYQDILKKSLLYKEIFQSIKTYESRQLDIEPNYNNGFLPGLDIIGIYTIISIFKPSKYVEVGSGNSTKVAFKAKRDNYLNTEIISIDPRPRSDIDNIADRLIKKPIEDLNIDFILSLKENDILFIDSSHRILPNSDSMVFFLDILPRLSSGVIVHIHDIYLPYDYPQFMCDRVYSEQYGLAIYLLANNEKLDILLPNYYISKNFNLNSILEPIWSHPNLKNVEKHGGSFWFRIK